MRWFLVLCLVVLASPAYAGWLDGWDSRVKLTVQSSVVDEDIDDFPVYVDLSAADFAALRAEGSTSDIAVTSSDGTTKLSRELLNFSATGGQLYFKGSIDADADTEFFIYWGNSGASESNDTATWSDFYAVFHFEDDPSDGTDEDAMTDSGPNGFNSSEMVGTWSSAAEVSGKVGNAWVFTDTDGRNVKFNTGFNSTADTYTILGWQLTGASVADGRAWWGAFDDATDRWYLWTSTEDTDGGRIFLGNFDRDGVANVRDSTWHMVGGIYDGPGDSAKFVADDATVGPTAIADGWLGSMDGDADDNIRFCIGSNVDTVLDEWYFWEEVKSLNYISTMYVSRNSPTTFYTVEASAPTRQALQSVFGARGSTHAGKRRP